MTHISPTNGSGNNNLVLSELAEGIRALGKQTVDNIIEIGRRLTECKRICGHGNWLPWLEQEFGWTNKTAENFINVHKLASKFENFSNLDLPLSGLYLLAAPSTPESAKIEVINRGTAGEALPVSAIKRTVDRHKARKLPAIKVKQPDNIAAFIEGEKARKELAKPKATSAQVQRDIEADKAHIAELEAARAHDRDLAEKLRAAEFKIVDLESEIAELKQENAELRARLEAAKAKPLDGTAPRKRGRPKGSKNKPRLPVAATVVTTPALGNDPGPIPECLRRDRVQI
jgi:hypothetical protein